jgi:hypothetical protein
MYAGSHSHSSSGVESLGFSFVICNILYIMIEDPTHFILIAGLFITYTMRFGVFVSFVP